MFALETRLRQEEKKRRIEQEAMQAEVDYIKTMTDIQVRKLARSVNRTYNDASTPHSTSEYHVELSRDFSPMPPSSPSITKPSTSRGRLSLNRRILDTGETPRKMPSFHKLFERTKTKHVINS
jgi:hypothetical protein